MWIKVFCIGCKWVLVLFGLVWKSVCKKGNVWFSKEMMSKICQNLCSCFIHRLSYNQPNEAILIVKEPNKIEIQIYRRDQEQIKALRLPKMCLKVSFG